jgi:hypothetical protein
VILSFIEFLTGLNTHNDEWLFLVLAIDLNLITSSQPISGTLLQILSTADDEQEHGGRIGAEAFTINRVWLFYFYSAPPVMLIRFRFVR